MIKPSSEIWNEISVTNNLEFEFHNLGTRHPIPIVIAKDVFKYPDKVREFLLTFPYWATKDIVNKMRLTLFQCSSISFSYPLCT